jgi:RNA polymerase sigma factor (sigma-70 family)
VPNPHEGDTYTQELSRAIDAAYELYRAGEPNGDKKLYDAFRKQARNVIWWKLLREDQALAHDVALRAFMALSKFRGKSRPSTWFYRIAKNEANRALEQDIEKRNRQVVIDPGGADDGLPVIELLAKPTNQDAALEVGQLSASLPREQLELISRLLEGYTVEEVARETGIALGTARSRHRLAKKKMAKRAHKKKPRR